MFCGRFGLSAILSVILCVILDCESKSAPLFIGTCESEISVRIESRIELADSRFYSFNVKFLLIVEKQRCADSSKILRDRY